MRDLKHFSAQDLLSHRQRLPRSQHIDALDLAYFLSLQTEEGAQVRAALVVSTQARTFPGEKLIGRLLAADIDHLRKLVSATDSETTAIHLAWDRDESPLLVRGICPKPHVPAYMAGHEDLLLIEVSGPGRIALVTVQDRIEYNRGEIWTPPALVLPDEFVSTIVQYLTTPTHMGTALRLGHTVVVFDQDAWTKHKDAFEGAVLSQAQHAVPAWIRLITREVEEGGHGGSLLLTTDTCPWRVGTRSFHDLRPVLARPRVPMPWNVGLLDLIGWSSHVQLASTTKALVLADVDASPEEWAVGSGLARVESSMVVARTDASRCARLCNMDGAVVFSPMLDPCAVGATFNLRDIPPAFQEHVEGRMHRHKSMASIVSTSPGSFGLAVSSDGGCTAFLHSHEGTLSATRL